MLIQDFTKLLLLLVPIISGFAPRIIVTAPPRCTTTTTTTITKKETAVFMAVRIDGYDEAFSIIDDCAVSGVPSDD
jgi:hypothetical protein